MHICIFHVTCSSIKSWMAHSIFSSNITKQVWECSRKKRSLRTTGSVLLLPAGSFFFFPAPIFHIPVTCSVVSNLIGIEWLESYQIQLENKNRSSDIFLWPNLHGSPLDSVTHSHILSLKVHTFFFSFSCVILSFHTFVLKFSHLCVLAE